MVELCTRKAIDNLRYLGDVGELDLYLLKDIVAHCTVDQLAHIENSTKVWRFDAFLGLLCVCVLLGWGVVGEGGGIL